MKAIAVGTVDEKQRKEGVCVIKKPKHEDAAPAPVVNGEKVGEPLPIAVLPPHLLEVPTAPATPVSATPASLSTADLPALAKESESVSGDEGFVNATEGLSLEDKKDVPSLPNGATALTVGESTATDLDEKVTIAPQ